MCKEQGLDVLITGVIVERLFDKTRFILEPAGTGVRMRRRDEPSICSRSR